MKAWQVRALGEPHNVLHLAAAAQPSPAPHQVLVRVLGAAANFPDVLLCRGTYQVRPALPFTPGLELCGEVVRVPDERSPVDVGDRVLGGAALPAGAFAEFALMDVANVYPAPDYLDDAEAASLYIGYQTGWFALHRVGRIQPGETLLVHAAAGGVGSAAVQLGKASGARVIAVVGGEYKASVARSLGADAVIDRHRDDFVQAVKDITGNRGADVVYDPVGGKAFEGSTKCIAFEGRILIIGFASDAIPRPALNHALIKNYSICGVHWALYGEKDPSAVRACHVELLRLCASGAIRPLVSERLPLSGLAAGLQRLAEGRTTGRIVVTP